MILVLALLLWLVPAAWASAHGEVPPNVDAPHIHFHLCDANSPLGCEGLPYVMERFELLGKLELGDDLGKARPWMPKAGQPADVRTRELPLEDQVVRFSAPPSRP